MAMGKLWNKKFSNKLKNQLFTGLTGIILPVMILIIWQGLSSIGYLNDYLLPSPGDIWAKFIELAGAGVIATHLMASLIRLIVGISITVLIAIPLGVCLGLFHSLQKYITPTLTFLQQIPPIAWIPIFILWFGIGEGSKLAIIIYAAFFPVFLNTLFGIQSVDQKLIEVSRVFMLSLSASVFRVYLPAALPYIFVGVRLGFSNCWRALVAAEIIASSKGIGYLLMEGRDLAQPERIFVSILIIGVIGTLLDTGLRKIEKRMLPGYEGLYEKSEKLS